MPTLMDTSLLWSIGLNWSIIAESADIWGNLLCCVIFLISGDMWNACTSIFKCVICLVCWFKKPPSRMVSFDHILLKYLNIFQTNIVTTVSQLWVCDWFHSCTDMLFCVFVSVTLWPWCVDPETSQRVACDMRSLYVNFELFLSCFCLKLRVFETCMLQRGTICK